jgi:hypothetical protein
MSVKLYSKVYYFAFGGNVGSPTDILIPNSAEFTHVIDIADLGLGAINGLSEHGGRHRKDSI